MFYPQCTIYNYGGHFIALPHTTRSGLRQRPKPPDELIAVAEKTDNKSDLQMKQITFQTTINPSISR